MRSLPILAAAGSVVEAVHPRTIVSENAYTCNPSNGIDISFTDSGREGSKIIADFPTIRMAVIGPAHGFPGGDSHVGCGGTVEWEDWAPYVRFAIANVTWRANDLNLTDKADFFSLSARVDMDVVHMENTTPVRYPLTSDKSSAAMLDVEINPKLDEFQGKYEVTAKNPKPFWSYCQNGYLSNTTTGWSMELGLDWEPCHEPIPSPWGQRVIKGWESCTYPQTNATATRLFPMLE
ncbi:hypothetical protein F4808DRAFT_461471 [Astrocystis sublimbata]|nr:hypothetical protein F4808DRAFT_461471 [Astrocystis sublimbata]